MAGVLSRAGIAAVITVITRKVTDPALFDDTPVGLRRRRNMVEGRQRLEAQAEAWRPREWFRKRTPFGA